MTHERRRVLASGLINTSQQVGGAIGTAVLSTVAFTHAKTLLQQGDAPAVATTGGFVWGFWVAAGMWTAGVAGLDCLRPARRGRSARGRLVSRLADLSGLPVTGLNELVLEVADLDAAARFYGEVLGLFRH